MIVRRGAALLAALLVALAGCGSLASSPSGPPTVAPDSGEQDQEPVNAARHCGVERWTVKTGSDADVSAINLTATPTATTIPALTALPAPNPIPLQHRVKPTEATVYQVHAVLEEVKMEADSDYHLVLSDAGRTMIAEIAAPSCTAADPLKPGITAARREMDARYHVGPTFQRVNRTVTVTGVGFFDFLHGQSGVAGNGIELHPVLLIVFGQ